MKVNRWNVYYEVEGEGEPVLLLHGIPTSSFIWRRQIEALSSRFRVYAPDLLGWGHSDKPPDFDYTVRAYVEFVDGFLAQVSAQRVILCVHDLGGAIGLAFLGRYPEKVSRLIVLNTFAYLPPIKYLPWAVLYGFLYRLPVLGDPLNRLVWETTVRRTDTFVTLAFHNKKLVTKELVAKYRELNRGTRLTDLRVLLANGIGGITGAVDQNSFNVRVPTLIVWAENDVLFPPWAALRLHRNIPGSILKTIPKCGHFLQEEKPDEVNRQLLEFLTQPLSAVRENSTIHERAESPIATANGRAAGH
ncbi:MAG: alpha/beta hydrolase [Chloroflexi bacterium]|nr:alpha/beta hydrolase [Chloroflexota bacterium]